MRAALLLLALVAHAATALADASDTAAHVHHEMVVHIDPARRTLQVEDRLDLSLDQPTEMVLGAGYTIETAEADGRPLPAPRTEEGTQRWALAGGPTPKRIVLRYSGTLAALRTMDHRGTLEALEPMAGERGTFLPAGSGWYPEVGEGSFTYRLTLALPAGQRGLVPGRLESESDGVQGYRAAFSFAHPAVGIDLMAGPYVVREHMLAREGGAPIRLRTWFHPEIADLAPDYLQSVAGYLDLYSRWIGAYAFDEFSVVSSPLPTGFGMPTLTYLGIDVLRLPFIRATSLGHEVLHNWWGNGVYVDYASGNWSEGLTTFMADYTYKEQESPQAALELRRSWLRDFAAVPPGQDLPLSAFTARTHGTSQVVGYDKAAFVFLMLRDRIGETAFDAGLRALWASHRFRRASWKDLQEAFARSSGADLSGFFEQWLSRRGAPALRITGASVQQDGAAHRVDVDIAQSEPTYALRVPLVLRAPAGDDARVVALGKAVERFGFLGDDRPASVLLDPELRVFRRLDPGEVPPILRQVMLAPGVRLLVAGPPQLADAAHRLAAALLDTPPVDLEPGTAVPAAPVLLIGTAAEVDAALATYGLPPRPAQLQAKGTAQVWCVRRDDGYTLTVISVAGPGALDALARPLPHHGRQSWLVFDGAKVIERGIWPAQPQAWLLH